MIRFIRDIHAKLPQYKSIIENSVFPSVQVGDFGFGFFYEHDVPNDLMQMSNARFIRGNHDDPSLVQNHSQWIQDGHCEITPKGTKIMYIGGAWSIDQAVRIEGKSWWKDEELTQQDFDRIIFEYITFQPDVVVTHDCPETIARFFFLDPYRRPIYKTLTGQALDAMFSLYQPQLWIFGHWHQTLNEEYNGTRFICLNELQYVDIDI